MSAVLRVVKGQPTDEELAALVLVLRSLQSRPESAEQPARTPSNWSAYWRSVGMMPSPGPDAWRQSGRLV